MLTTSNCGGCAASATGRAASPPRRTSPRSSLPPPRRCLRSAPPIPSAYRHLRLCCRVSCVLSQRITAGVCVLSSRRLQPYFVGAQQVDSAYKQTFAVEIIKKAAEEGCESELLMPVQCSCRSLLVSGVAAVERITKALWVDLALVMPTPSGIGTVYPRTWRALKLMRRFLSRQADTTNVLLNVAVKSIGTHWVGHCGVGAQIEEPLDVRSRSVNKPKSVYDSDEIFLSRIATSGLMVARFLWLAVNAEYKLYARCLAASGSASRFRLQTQRSVPS